MTDAPIRFAVVALALFLASCSIPGMGGQQGGQSGSSQPTAPDTPPNRYTAEQTADAAVGTWRGSYACSQGSTGVDVVFERDGADRLRGTFRFYPLPANPGVARGCFNMTGTAGPAGRIRTTAGNWVTHPPSYVPGDIEGGINNDGTFSGNVIVPGGQCGGFLIRRTSEAPVPC